MTDNQPDLATVIRDAANRARQIIDRAEQTALTLAEMGLIPTDLYASLRNPPSTGSTGWSASTDQVRHTLDWHIKDFIDQELTFATDGLMPVKALGLQWAEYCLWTANRDCMSRDGVVPANTRPVLEQLVKAVAELDDVTYYAPGKTFMGIRVSANRQ